MKKGEKMKYTYYQLGIMAAVVSFLGFVVENIWLAMTKGYINNRNMNAPFLLGYGLLILFMYAVFGTPAALRMFAKEKVRWKRYLVYFLCSFAVVCVGEIVLGIVVERLAYKPLRAAPSLAVLITAIGVSYFLQNAALLLWTSNPKVFPNAFVINTTDEAQIREAYELLADAKSKGVYQSFVMDEVFGKMEGSNAAIAMYYAGDYLTMLDNNPDLKFVVPKEGSNWFVDAMCVLKTAQHKEEAEAWINFIASTESNLANMDYIGYASPNLEALEGYPAYYEETYGEPLDEERYEIMAAPDDVLARCELYTNLPADTLTLYNDLWTELGI